jgi:hypothetical protein
VRKSVDGGAGFLPGSCALASDPGFRPGITWTAVDPHDAGRVYVAFSAAVSSLGSSEHVYVIRSTDAGASWSAPVRVDDALPDDVVDHLRPSLSVSAAGRLDLAWVDYRQAPAKRLASDRQPGDVYYSYSLDEGQTWSANVRLSGRTAPLLASAVNDYVTVVSSGNEARAAYAQDRNGNARYEARLTTITFHSEELLRGRAGEGSSGVDGFLEGAAFGVAEVGDTVALGDLLEQVGFPAAGAFLGEGTVPGDEVAVGVLVASEEGLAAP